MAGESKKACCLISEMLEETGLDRDQLRRFRRQVLEGVILFCRWQLDRMEKSRPAPGTSPGARKVKIE